MIQAKNISHNPERTTLLDKIRAQPRERLRIATGDVTTSAKPVVMHTILGSCVAVCLYDPLLLAGGMNHILLPGTREDACSTRLGVYAMELLINELMKRGGDRRRFLAKAFGGANIMTALKTTTVGDDNAEFVCSFLAAENIPLVAQRLGGTHAVQVSFNTESGKAIVQSVDGSRLPNLMRAEDSYRRSHRADSNQCGEITLF